jgi:putative membrane protein
MSTALFAISGMWLGWYHGPGTGWPWFGLAWLLVALLFWGGILLLAWWGIRSFSRAQQERDSALAVLRRRFAGGEISREDYDRTRKVLEG